VSDGVSRPEPAQVPAELMQPAVDAGQPPAARHNHVTRDIKPRGVCPACDRHWSATDERLEALLRADAAAILDDDLDADEQTVGMELMDAWNAAHQGGGVAVMAVMGHQELAGYRFVIQVNGADYQVTVRDVTARELDGPA
jgi:hypothetical protein